MSHRPFCSISEKIKYAQICTFLDLKMIWSSPHKKTFRLNCVPMSPKLGALILLKTASNHYFDFFSKWAMLFGWRMVQKLRNDFDILYDNRTFSFPSQLGCTNSDPTFDSDFCKIVSLTHMLFGAIWVIYTKNRKFIFGHFGHHILLLKIASSYTLFSVW